MTRIGTSYFVSRSHAVHYYYSQGYGDSYREASFIVQQKLDAGEIHVGKPDLKASERLVLIDNGDRYAIEES